jgi:uncharacterized membrane protein YkoI
MRFAALTSTFAALVLCACLGTGSTKVEDSSRPALAGSEEGEVQLALADVPEAVRAAALAAVPGLQLTSAERETEDGELVYCLEGTANGEAIDIDVAPDGTIIEIERGEDDDDDDDDDDGDDAREG